MLQLLDLVYVWVGSFHYDHMTMAHCSQPFKREWIEILGWQVCRRPFMTKHDHRECFMCVLGTGTTVYGRMIHSRVRLAIGDHIMLANDKKHVYIPQ